MRWVCATVLLLCSWAQAEDDGFYLEGNRYVSASIVGSASTLSSSPSDTAYLAIHFEIEKGWHIYWKNPGESGLPTIVEWKSTGSWQIGPTAWPAPHRIIEQGNITTYGYNNELTLPSAVSHSLQSNAGVQSLDVQAQISWLVCKDICVPGRTTVKRSFPVHQEAPLISNEENLLIQTAIANSPTWDAKGSMLEGIKARAYLASLGDEQGLVVELDGNIQKQQLAHLNMQIFPDNASQVFFGVPFALKLNDTLAAAMPYNLAPNQTHTPPLSGTIVVSDKITGLEHPLSLNWQTAPSDSKEVLDPSIFGQKLSYRLIDYSTNNSSKSGVTPLEEALPVASAANSSLLVALLASLVAGLLLNIMPCVLPVISIKIISFIEGVGEEAKVNKLAAFVFSLGILSSFLALGFLVVSLRNLGHQVGWGFQFQYPGFVFALIIVIFVLALGFFELYTINAPGMAKASHKADSIKGRYAKNFADGILATLLATPCAAPFLGTALAFAFTQPPFVIYLIFLCIGLGLALPYALVASSTTILRCLPRPGPWMFRVREFMGILLLATVIWLVYVLGKFSDLAVATALGSLLVIFFAFRLNHWTKDSSLSLSRKRLIQMWLWGLCLFTLVYSWEIVHQTAHSEVVQKADGIWQPYSDELVEDSLANNQIVFIDFTAAWCITCKANEQLVLSTAKVLDAFKQRQVVTLKADWTTGDKHVGAALKRYGGAAVPYYVIISPDKASEPKILPTILTPSLVVNAITGQNQ